MTGEFSVAQFFDDETYEYVRRFVTAGEAMVAARDYSRSVAARSGLIAKIIITDGGDYTVFQWERGKGITYPPEAKGADIVFNANKAQVDAWTAQLRERTLAYQEQGLSHDEASEKAWREVQNEIRTSPPIRTEP